MWLTELKAPTNYQCIAVRLKGFQEESIQQKKRLNKRKIGTVKESCVSPPYLSPRDRVNLAARFTDLLQMKLPPAIRLALCYVTGLRLDDKFILAI